MNPYPMDETPRWLEIDDGESSPAEVALPDLTSLNEQIKKYQASVFGLFFPVIDHSLFQHTIKAAYFKEQSTVSTSSTTAKACIFAFCALSLQVLPDSTEKRSSLRPGIEFFREAYHGDRPGAQI